MALTLSYSLTTSIPVEIEGVVPDRLRDKSVAQIETLVVHHGNQTVPLAEVFEVKGDAADGRIDLEGDLSGVHQIGYGMTAGEMHVHGHAGRHVGAGMLGGRITVSGDVGDWVGCEMHGGMIDVAGNAGDHAGAAYPGSKRGMTDGTILIQGNSGDQLGARMRRGTIAVLGSCGDAPGFNMIAGSILVWGACGRYPGAGMKRGTLALFGDEPATLLPTFRETGRFRPLFLRLLIRELLCLGFPVDPNRIETDLVLSHGDLIALGKGEIWARTHG